MTIERFKCLNFELIKTLQDCSPMEKFTSLQQQRFLKYCGKEFLNFCSECAIDIINCTVPVDLELQFYKPQL